VCRFALWQDFAKIPSQASACVASSQALSRHVTGNGMSLCFAIELSPVPAKLQQVVGHTLIPHTKTTCCIASIESHEINN
jgi:hypothetical protein